MSPITIVSLIIGVVLFVPIAYFALDAIYFCHISDIPVNRMCGDVFIAYLFVIMACIVASCVAISGGLLEQSYYDKHYHS